MIVDEVCLSPSHWNKARTLPEWLAEHGVVGIRGIDTRRLTQKIRESGTMLGKILVAGKDDVGEEDDAIGGDADCVPWKDPAKLNLVREVSCKVRREGGRERERHLSFSPPLLQTIRTLNAAGWPRICAVDCGLKNNQLRCLVSRGARVDVVPWDHRIDQGEYDGLFLSNGPGDPQACADTVVANLRRIIAGASPGTVKPIFGICLGHQLIGVAAGCSTKKMK